MLDFSYKSDEMKAVSIFLGISDIFLQKQSKFGLSGDGTIHNWIAADIKPLEQSIL